MKRQLAEGSAFRSGMLRTALLAFLTVPFVTMTTPLMAQDGNGSATAQQNADVGPHGVYKVGGDVSAPVLIHSVEPESSEKAGEVLVNLWVDVHGNPSHVHVIHGAGMGLDEKAIEAVHQYKFKPAMKNGKPVMVELNVVVKFQTTVH